MKTNQENEKEERTIMISVVGTSFLIIYGLSQLSSRGIDSPKMIVISLTTLFFVILWVFIG